MPETKGQNFQDVQESALNVTGLSSRSTNETILSAFDQDKNQPLRLTESTTPDSLLNIKASKFQMYNGVEKNVSPINNVIPNFVETTINFQTQAVTGGTVNITWPTSTVGQYRLFVLTLLSNGQVEGEFSDEETTIGALPDPGSLFIGGGLPIGWVVLECTNTTGYFKTAGSSTNIIENKVGSDSRIFIFESGNSNVEIKHNYSATTAPTVNNDDSENYSPGSSWVDVTNDKFYKCLDSSTGAAVWIEIVNTVDTQTLTNKTLTSPAINGANQNMGTASNSNRIVLPKDTTVNLDALTDVEALLAYDTTQNKPTFNNGSGWNILDVPGVANIVSKSGAYNVTTSDDIILCDSSGGAFTNTLYAASGNAGRKIVFIKTSSDFNAITIDGNGSETINGNLTTTINTQYERLELICDGSNSLILKRDCNTAWKSFTPTGTWTTNVTYTGFWRRVGDTIQIQYRVSCTGVPAPSATILGFNEPTFAPTDTSKITYGHCLLTGSANSGVSGRNAIIDCEISGGVFYPRLIYRPNTATHDTTPVNSTSGVPFTFGSGNFVNIIVQVPVTGWKAENE